MKGIQEWLQSKGMKRLVVILLLIVFIFVFRSMMNLLLIFFILTYLMNQLHKVLKRRVKSPVAQSVILILQYGLFIALIALGIYRFIPSVITELTPLLNQVIDFYEKPLPVVESQFLQDILVSIQNIDLGSYVDQGMNFLLKLVNNISTLSMNIMMAMILSLFFLLEKDRIKQFMHNLKKSKLDYVYDELNYFGHKFIHSFGKVLEVQVLISFLNCLMSVAFLWIMGFPNLIALGIMIFILGLIPVAGVFISLIPLCAIAFTIGGIKMVIYVLIMIAVLHAFEAYLLNPKLMSAKTKLPIFFTFIVLLFAEHFIGVWGLILGIPLFIFILDLFEVPFTDKPELETN